jgi:HD-GYP domain-containing protein (c-di-GMP phosphodiesterase class II)
VPADRTFLARLERTRDLRGLVLALRHDSVEVRVAAATALGRLGGPAVVEPLCSALQGDDCRLREAAANALDRVGLPADDAIQAWYAVAKGDWFRATALGVHAIAPLSAALKDQRWAARRTAAEALGRLADPAAEPALRAVLEDPSPEVRMAAGQALERMTASRSVLDTAGRRPSGVVRLVRDVPVAGLRRQYESNSGLAFEGGERETEAARWLEALCTMTRTVFSGLSVGAILDAAAGTVLTVSGGRRVAILVPDPATGRLEPVATRVQTGTPATVFRVSATIVEEAVRQGVSILCSDAALDDRFRTRDSVLGQRVRTVICVPLQAETRNLGAVYVDYSKVAAGIGERHLRMVAALGQQAGMALERAALVRDLEDLFVGALLTVTTSIEVRDPYTRGHSERVTHFALRLGRELGVSGQDFEALELAGLMHDLGKLGVPDQVLGKPGPLSDAEFDLMKRHPDHGVRILANLPELERIVPIRAVSAAVRHHHERFDGHGYPAGLAGDGIPLLARILAVADTFDAVTSERPYRAARSAETARDILCAGAGSQWDPAVLRAFDAAFLRGDFSRHDTVEGRFRKARVRVAAGPAGDPDDTAPMDRLPRDTPG